MAPAQGQLLFTLVSEAMIEGFAVCRVSTGRGGRVARVRVEWANPALLRALGGDRSPVGRDLERVMPQADFDWLAACQDVFESGAPQTVDCKGLFGNGPCELRFTRVEPDRITLLLIDRTQAWREERRHTERFAELNHRTKNSLANVAGLLRLQGARAADPGVREQLLKASNRVEAVSHAHASLCYVEHNDTIDLSAYLADLCGQLDKALGEHGRITVEFAGEPVSGQPEHMLPLGIIVNELTTNAVKYAFPAGAGGQVLVRLGSAPDGFILTVSDNGCGLPDKAKASGLGLQLVRSLVRQLGGRLEVRRLSPGTQFEMSIALLATNAQEGQGRLL